MLGSVKASPQLFPSELFSAEYLCAHYRPAGFNDYQFAVKLTAESVSALVNVGL